MGQQAPVKKNNSDHPISHVLSWMATKTKCVTGAHLEGMVAATIFISTCFFTSLMYKNLIGKKRKNRRPTARTFHRSLSLSAVHGGKVAMQRILDAQHVRVNPSALDGAAALLKDLLKEDPLDFEQLQSVVAKLEMSGKEAKALGILKEARENAIKKGHHHEAYELEMMIVEVLIYKGDYINALKCKCLEDEAISDARRPLYKAVIQVMLGNRRVAEEFWNEFQTIQRQYQWPDCSTTKAPSVHEVAHDFDKFQKIVDYLKLEIDAVHKKPN
ncbi:uncharacterized protein LOC143861778 isoform X1 [Tasmannia lanceolata]|uniref:uncharacterized protein LOC143861778 isoform X1 n=1 Tax=Tasmannia lanceolata TaxID=3420 RepID=UPI00406483C4